MMKNKKVLITGFSGQDGATMTEYLLKNTEHEIVGLMRRTSQTIDSNIKQFIGNSRVRILQFDLNDVHSITSVIKSEVPDYFLNFGAQTFVADSWNSPVNFFTTNTFGVLHILEAIRSFCPLCRFYQAGSSEEWGDVDYTPQDELHALKPRSPYGASKASARLITKVYRESYNLYAIQGFLLNHEGPLRQEYFVSQKIAQGVARIKRAIDKNKKFEPIELGNLNAVRDWGHAKDFVDGIWKMINQEVWRHDLQPQYYNEGHFDKDRIKPLKEYVLSSNESHSVREFVEKAFEVAEINGGWQLGFEKNGETFESSFGTLVKINPKFYRPAEVELLQGDSSLAREELAWKPKYSFDDLVKEMTLNALCQNP